MAIEGGLIGDLVLGVDLRGALLERRRDGEQLAGRARFEDFGDRPVAAVLVVDGPEIVGVVARIVGQGQYLAGAGVERHGAAAAAAHVLDRSREDRKSTRLNSSHVAISYAVFCSQKNR